MTSYQNLTFEEKIKIAIKIKDAAGFYVQYFNYLPHFSTQIECFNYLNDIHLDVYGVEKYSSYQSFNMYMYRESKKKKNRK